MATSAVVEVGTCIYSLPLRNKYEVAQRFLTMETILPERFTFGVGTGSQEIEYEANGLNWQRRFIRMADHMASIRELFGPRPADQGAGQGDIPVVPPPSLSTRLGAGDPGTWAERIGRPRFALGAWHGKIQLKIAATEYDGWIASGGPGTQFGGWRKVFSESIKRYRDLGGKRALVSTVAVDLKGAPDRLKDEGAFSLVCPPEVAVERLQLLEDMGFDDVVLHVTSQSLPEGRRGISRRYDPTSQDLAEIRALLPKDSRDYRAG
jgi:alkanesulfonate monooxygenase SsuD/methylene tetrahydromethanopterin reductase-like flavin-dependent oxidoreductase (luciferase family)